MSGIVISHASSIKRPLVNNGDDFSGGGLKLFTVHGERESQRLGSWPESQTAAIKSSGRENVFLKLGAHILVVGTHAVSVNASHFSRVPLLLEEYVCNQDEKHLFQRTDVKQQKAVQAVSKPAGRNQLKYC